MKDKFTPNYIESLEENEVFVFGSKLDGYHIGGAAMIAKERFGAVWGQGFLNHPILGERLRAVTKALLTHADLEIEEIFGEIDAMKVCSCMTLFDAVSPDDVFQDVLDRFYEGKYDLKTLNYM